MNIPRKMQILIVKTTGILSIYVHRFRTYSNKSTHFNKENYRPRETEEIQKLSQFNQTRRRINVTNVTNVTEKGEKQVESKDEMFVTQ